MISVVFVSAVVLEELLPLAHSAQVDASGVAEEGDDGRPVVVSQVVRKACALPRSDGW